MKSTLLTIAMVCFVLLQQGFNQVTGVKYLLKYNTTSCRYDACIVITAGNATTAPQRAQFNSQYTIVVPHGSALSIAQNFNPIQNNQTYAGTIPLVWVVSSSVLGPNVTPNLDYYSVTPTLSPTSFYNNLTLGDTVKLFSININPLPSCGAGVRPYQNGSDPGSSADGMNGGDFTNGFTIGGLTQDYQDNLPTIIPPQPNLNANVGCASGINIDLNATTSACQTPLTYAWTGPGGYTGTTQDVSISNATYNTNGGSYQVIVTDKLSCKDTLTVQAFPRPIAGADVQLCRSNMATLTGTEPTTGTWSAASGNPSGAVLGTPNNGVVDVDLSGGPEGNYAFIYSNNNCGDTVIVHKASADAGADPSPLLCYSNGIATMAATGTGTWSLGAGSAGTVVINNASNPTTTVDQFSAPGNYNMIWTSGGCTDTAVIVANNNCSGCLVNNNNITGPTQNTFCNTSGALSLTGTSANPAGGIYLWQHSMNGGAFNPASGTNNTKDYTTVSLGVGSHTIRRLYTTTSAPICTDTSNEVVIVVSETPSAPTGLSATPNPVCLGSSVTLSATNVAGSVYSWTASSGTAGLVPSTTNTTTMTPTSAGMYAISVTRTLNGCTSTAANINVNAVNTPPTPSDITFVDPSSCGGNQGSISISGLDPNTTFVVHYQKNGTPVTVNLTTNGTGDLSIINLTSGNYTNFSLSVGACTSGVFVGPITLSDPNAPTAPVGITASDLDICTNATVNVSVTNNPGATYAWTSSNTAVLAIQSPSTTNSVTLIGVAQGSATVSVTQTLGGCVSPPATIIIQVSASPATPNSASVTFVNPTVCEGTDGSISFSGQLPNTTLTIAYLRNGLGASANVSSNGAGIATITGLNAATYSNFVLTNAAGCSSGLYAGPVVLSDPGNTTPSNINVNPNPICMGKESVVSVQNIPGATYMWTASSAGVGMGQSTSNTINLSPLEAGIYTISVTQTVSGCVSPPAIITVMVRDDCYNPDFGVTFPDVELTGNLSTNDDEALGTEYLDPTPNAANPSSCLPVVSSDGTYSFTCGVLGEYYFLVPVCRGENCISMPLAITLIEEESQTNPPIANFDYITTKVNTSVSINVLLNDKCQSKPNCSFDIPTIVTAPVHGSYNASTGLYTPANGYFGKDSLKYRVCQSPATPPVSCDEEWVYITILPSYSTNFTNAMDDYGQTTLNTVLQANVSRGVKANDTDPEGNNTTIGAFNKSVSGKGSLVLAADGSYTFTPALDFIGPIDFPYEICDNGNPTACDSATLHILVESSLPVGSIGDFVWLDQNGNGIQNGGEPGIGNVTVKLYNETGSLVRTTTTAANGSYLFQDVLIGNYYVEFVPASGYDVTFAGKGTTSTDSDITGAFGPGTTNLFAVNAGENNLTVDAGYYQCSKIGNRVWYDINKNDIWDSTENGINGLQVNLWRNNGGTWVLWDTDITGHNPDPNKPSDDGFYEFCAAPGTYYIQFILPPDNKLVPVRPFIGGNSLTDSDINNANGPATTPSFSLSSGQNKTDIGAGFYPMASAGNLVWLDQNYNGIQELEEPKLEGVLVQAYNSVTNEMVAETVTNADGTYVLDYLPKMDLYLKFTPPAGYNPTYPGAGNDDINSDVDHSNGFNTTRSFSMYPGIYNDHIDMGLALGALPVKWVNVEVKKVKDGHSILWETAEEINLDYYEVQRILQNGQIVCDNF